MTCWAALLRGKTWTRLRVYFCWICSFVSLVYYIVLWQLAVVWQGFVTSHLCSQKRVRSVSTLALTSCRFRPDQPMNRWPRSTNAAMPSVGTDGETETFCMLYYYYFSNPLCFVLFPQRFPHQTEPFIYWAATLILLSYIHVLSNFLWGNKKREHRWSCLELFFIDKIVPVYNRQPKFDLHSSTDHRQRAMQTSRTQDDGVHHFMVSFKAFTNLKETPKQPQNNPNRHWVKELAGENYRLWCGSCRPTLHLVAGWQLGHAVVLSKYE